MCLCEKCNCFMQYDGIHECRSSHISGRAILIEVSRVHATIWLYARQGYVHDEFSKNPSVSLVLS
jgi:hypothetical protein